MLKLTNIISEYTVSGVYMLDQDTPIDQALELSDQRGLNTYVLKGDELRDKESLLKSIGELFKFPDYYGGNWDALEECLSDMFLDEKIKGVTLICDHAEVFLENSPNEFQEFIDMLIEITQICETQEDAFVVLLSGVSDSDLGLPKVGL